MYIYLIKNNVNGNCYVGATVKPLADRFYSHTIRAGNNPSTVLHWALCKHGFDAFDITMLEEGFADADDMFEAERKWIKALSPKYNMTAGGEGGDTSTSKRYRDGIANRNQSGENNPMFGRRHSDEVKLTISKKKTGKKLDPEHRAKAIAALRANQPDVEARRRGALARSGDWEVTTPDGEVIIVRNLSGFCREHGLSRGNIGGPYKTSKGYKAVPLVAGQGIL